MLTRIAAFNIRGEPVTCGVSEQRVRESVYSILDECALCSIATVTPENRAHINIAYAAHTRDLRLCFLSHPTALHCRNLQSNSSMAIAVYPSSQQWGGPDRGLQLFGSCRLATATDLESARAVYGARFTRYDTWAASLSEDDVGREYRLYWFTAHALKVSDERTFGDGVIITADVQR